MALLLIESVESFAITIFDRSLTASFRDLLLSTTNYAFFDCFSFHS